MLNGKNKKLRLDLLTTLKGVVTLVLDPSRADATPDIEDGMIELKATQLAIKHIQTIPAVASIIRERYLAPPPDLAALDQ
jgi:ubiquinone biosynthesis protein COQ4